ncbi:TPA: HNH endonuclease [Neisseria lactamica]
MGTAWEASGNFNQSKASGSSDSAAIQSGLFAGEGGYHIEADSIHLKGGAITATAPKEQNELTAKRLTFENIQNQSSYSASNVSLSGSYGSDSPSETPDNADFRQTNLGKAFARSAGKNGIDFNPGLPQYEKGGDNSTTYATLSEGRLNIGGKETTTQELGINSDSSNAHRAVAALPDLAKITEKQQIIAKATSDIVTAAHTFSSNRQKTAAKNKAKAESEFEGRLKAQNDGSYDAYAKLDETERQKILINYSETYRKADAEAQNWGVGGKHSRALNAGITLATGLLGGQSGLQSAVNAAAPYASEAIGRTFGHGENKNETAQAVGHFLLGAAIARVNGGNFAAGGSAAVAAEKAAEHLAQRYNDGKTAIDPQTGEFNANLLPEHIKEEIKSKSGVIASLTGAAVGGTPVDAQTGGAVGQNAVENNGVAQKTAKTLGKVSDDTYRLVKDSITPRNSALAGKAHPVTKVHFDGQGYPDFSAHLYIKNGKNVDLNIGQLTGDRRLDAILANAAAGFDKTPEGYVWHHHQDLGRMQLVKKDVHDKTGHTGGFSIYSRALAIGTGIITSIQKASASDYIEFVGEMMIPLALTPSPLADGTLDGEARRQGFQNWQSYLKFQERVRQLRNNSKFNH